MADNTQIAGGTGDTVRDKDRAGVKTQIVGLDLGIGSGAESLMTIGQHAKAAAIGVTLASDEDLLARLPAALGAGGGLKVDGSGTTLPVSGTVTTTPPANASTNVAQISGTAASVNSGTKDAGTLRVVLATDQPQLTNALKSVASGTAGTAGADVESVQGIAGMVPVTGGLKQVNISVTPAVSTSPAYTAGDAMGGLLTFANAARVNGGSGLIQAVTVMCKTPALLPALELVLFNQTFTAPTDNAVFNPSDADMANCIGVIPINSWSDFNLNSIATRFGLAFPFLLTGTSLFGQLVTRSAITFVGTTDLIIGVEILQD